MKKTLFVFFFGLLQTFVFANPFPIGARSWGFGNATVAISDRNSVFGNPAGLGFLKENNLNTSAHSRFGISGLQNLAIFGNFNTKILNLGLGIDRFGDKLYSEQRIGLALGKSTNRIALGLKINYLQANIENLASKNSLLSEFGIIAKLTSKVQMGFHAYNLTGSKLFASQRIPTLLRFGFSFEPTKQILLLAEAEKDLDFKPIIKAGIEYQMVKNFFLRTGVSTQTNTFHFGVGFQTKKFLIDFATSSHSALGLSHHFSIGFIPQKK